MLGENHCHIALDGADYKAAISRHSNGVDDEWIEDVFKTYLKQGVSFLRDGGDKNGVSQRAKLLAPEFGIDYRTPVFAIYKKGNYGSILGKCFENEKELIDLVASAKKQGADFIKIMATGILDFNEFGKITQGALSYDELKMIVKICHGEGLSVMSHTNGGENIKNALMAGVDSIEHGFYINEECLELIKEVNAVWVPTLTACKNLLDPHFCHKLSFNEASLRKIAAEHEKMIAKGLNKGCLIALGSDAGAFGVPHGEGAKYEIAYFSCLYENADLLPKLQDGQNAIIKRFRPW